MKQIGMIVVIGLLFGEHLAAQEWQQRVDYTMEIDFDAQQHQYTGTQELWYYNHSPDTLTRAFYHLYFNAFQPGSVMDMYTRNVPDPDPRVARIPFLKPSEQGFLHILTLQQDQSPVEFEEAGTILEVQLAEPVTPGDSTLLSMTFKGQVPVMTRRAGRESAEGVAYSMAQWYPKLCAYDEDGWHPNPYVGREFYADFGTFDVRIRIDEKFTLGASGILQNPAETGKGYADATPIRNRDGDKLTWHFIAEDVHDFTWAADEDYTHHVLKRDDGVELRFLYKETSKNKEAWAALPEIMDHSMTYLNDHYGQYPYPTYAFVQGGDGGMEYPMLTLITGERSLRSLVGVSVHELVHSWYQMVLATNESLYPWMDEGFTEYVENKVILDLQKHGFLPASTREVRRGGEYFQYYQLVASGLEEPMSTHSDHFLTNTAYGISAYSKGSIFLSQLEYIVGEEAMERIMFRYFNTWKFRHPEPLDFIRVAEKESGMVLDWYYEYWVLTTKTIDYGVVEARPKKRHTEIVLKKTAPMPMPVEVEVEMRNGEMHYFYIPLDLMRANKPVGPEVMVLPDWQSTNLEYTVILEERHNRIAAVRIDPAGRTADIGLDDNFLRLIPEQE